MPSCRVLPAALANARRQAGEGGRLAMRSKPLWVAQLRQHYVDRHCAHTRHGRQHRAGLAFFHRRPLGELRQLLVNPLEPTGVLVQFLAQQVDLKPGGDRQLDLRQVLAAALGEQLANVGVVIGQDATQRVLRRG